ncbi:MAG: hypothetical protein PHC88_01015 [Terrimicrobiaceae bacterium]|nr:hypothetical protein [Terrimicrobiaceae bacterium]
MKPILLFASIAALLASAIPAQAGSRVSFFFSSGGYGCAPRYYAPPVCYAPRPVFYCAPRVVYCQPAPIYYAPAPVVYAPYAPIYRAPVVGVGVNVCPVAFGWRR